MLSLLPGLLWIAIQASADAPGPHQRCKDNPTPDDGRPYMLCLTETEFEIADARLNRQWRKTLTSVSRITGVKAKKQLLTEQRRWLLNRDRECNSVALSFPVQHSGTNQMACLTQITRRRTAVLAQMIK